MLVFNEIYPFFTVLQRHIFSLGFIGGRARLVQLSHFTFLLKFDDLSFRLNVEATIDSLQTSSDLDGIQNGIIVSVSSDFGSLLKRFKIADLSLLLSLLLLYFGFGWRFRLNWRLVCSLGRRTLHIRFSISQLI